MSQKLIITERDGALDWKDVVITSNGQSCTAQEVFDGFNKLIAERDQLQERVTELESDVKDLHAGIAAQDAVLTGNYNEVVAANRTLRGQLAEARLDTERLNKLERISRHNSETSEGHDWTVRFCKTHTSLRSAIDMCQDYPALTPAPAENEGAK